MTARKMTIAVLLAVLSATGYSQTLFTYGKKAVTKDEFLKAYNKNNTEEKPTDKSYRDYLELYARFKIKVQAAYDLKLDTLPSQQAELTGFRNQVVESYMKDEASVNVLIEEAAERSRKDIHLAHIFIPLKSNASAEEVAAAENKIKTAYTQLQKGQDFGAVAASHSEDPSAKFNKGDIGFITVFVLPYELENLAYTTPAGKFSAPVRTRVGFHIFKNLGERKALGRIRAAQILLSYPPGAADVEKQATKQKADSVYHVLVHGGDFAALAGKLSNDNITYQSGGEMPVFGVGRYEPAFEEVAFSLEKDGDLSKPVATEFGYHLIKRIQRQPVPADANDKKWREELKQQVQQSDRMEVSKKTLIKKIQQLANYKKLTVKEASLWVFTDSVLQSKTTPKLPGLAPTTGLFSFGKQTFTVADWQHYLESIRPFENMLAGKTKPQLFDQFVEASALDYYRNNLELYNKDFAYQLNEFKDGNLLFEVMQRKIWDVAATDSIALKKYYDAHAKNYWWEMSADAVIFTASNEAAAETARKQLKENIADWKKYISNSDGLLQGDSGRFELGQIPVVERTNFTNGLITANVKNETDNSITFAYIIAVHKDREPRSFTDARGFVINDYQAYLEEQWIEELKKKYPIVMNEAVIKSLPK